MRFYQRIESGRDGLLNIVAAWLIMFTIIGIPAIMVPVLYAAIIDDTGWTRGQVALLTSMKFAAGAVTTFFCGFFIARFGERVVTITCVVITGGALIAMLAVNNLTIFYLLGGLLGIGALGAVTTMKILLSKWFDTHQGVAIGIALTGLSVAGVTVPLIATLLNQQVGWRMTAALMSLPLWLVALPVFLWAAKEVPAAALQKTVPAQSQDKADLNGVFKSSSFWLLVTTSFLIGMVDHSMSAHLVIYFDKDLRLGAEVAAIGFSAMMLMSNAGKLIWGWLFDRLSAHGVALCWFITAVGIALSLMITDIPTLLLFAIVYGPCQGGMLLMVSVLSKHCFGTRTLAYTIAILSGVFNIGSAVGPAVTGYGFDITGSYHVPFTAMAVAALLSCALALFIDPAFRRSSAKSSKETVPPDLRETQPT